MALVTDTFETMQAFVTPSGGDGDGGGGGGVEGGAGGKRRTKVCVCS